MSLWRGTLCANCKKEHECVEAERMFKRGDIAYGCSACVPKPQTNADRIRSMTDEELAEMLCSGTCKYCHSYNKDCDILDWLRKESKDG